MDDPINEKPVFRNGKIRFSRVEVDVYPRGGTLGHWLDMVYLPPRGNFVDHVFLEAQCLARILQHVSPLTMAASSCNSLLHTLPYKIFDY